MVEYKEILRRQNVRDAVLKFNNNSFNWRNGVPFSRLLKIRNAIPVNALIESRLSGVMGRKTSIEQGEADKKVLDTVNYALSGLNIENITAQVFDAVLFGFSLASLSWTIKGGIYVPENIEFLSIDGWRWANSKLEYGGYSGKKIVIDEENEYVFIPTFRRKRVYDPLGAGVLNNLFWHVQYIEAGLEFWVEFAEKYGSPFLAAKTRPNANESELSLIDKMLAAIKKAGWMRVPQGTDLQFLEAAGKGASADVYKGLLQYIREDITLEVLGHTGAAISTAGKLGSEDNALKVREDITDLDCAVCADFFNNLIKKITALNFGHYTQNPKFAFLPKEDAQNETAERDKKIYDMGINIAPQYFAQKYGIPLEFLSQREIPTQLNERQKTLPNEKITLENDRERRDEENDIDYFGLDSIVEQVEEIVNECENYEEAKEKIIDKFGEIDNSYLSQVLENALAFSELKGRKGHYAPNIKEALNDD